MPLTRDSKIALAEILNRIDHPDCLSNADLRSELESLAAAPLAGGFSWGITGPPGVGKSTLIAALARWSDSVGLDTGVLAVDPSSRESGGALLGDRIRMRFAEIERAPFIRSIASRSALGGIADFVYPALLVMRAHIPFVMVETIGVGQAEIEIASVADRTLLVLQPGSGDQIQFLKSGIMEIPDLIVVHKSDLTQLADKTCRDVRQAVHSAGRETQVLLASAETDQGVNELLKQMQKTDIQFDADAHTAGLLTNWQYAYLLEQCGKRGIERMGGVDAVRKKLTESWLNKGKLIAGDLIQL